MKSFRLVAIFLISIMNIAFGQSQFSSNSKIIAPGDDPGKTTAKENAPGNQPGCAFFEQKGGNALVVKAGGYQIRFAEASSWTFQDVFYNNKAILIPAGWQQAVIGETKLPKGGDGFLGSGHRKEKILSLNLSAYQNGKLLKTYPVAEGLSVTGGTFFVVEKQSQFISEHNGLFYDHTARISIGADGLSEDFHFKVTGENAACVTFMYVFMHIFPKATQTWVVGDEQGEIERGMFVADASFTLKKDFLWLFVYNPADEIGIVCKYPETYEGMEGFKNSFWNRKNDNKLYLKIDPKRNKGEEFSYSVKLKAFETKENNWEAEAKKVLATISFNR